MRWLRFLGCALLLLHGACHAAPAARAAPKCAVSPRLEMSLGGYQSPQQPARGGDRLNLEYVLPSDETLTYFKKKGITVFRLPMLWERMQPKASGPLDPAKVLELKAFLDRADKLEVRFIIDLHAYARRDDGKLLGTPQLPVSALTSFWAQFAQTFHGRFDGYDIMNEPHNMPDATVWPIAAQATVDAIRKRDSSTTIYVEGDDWANAERWPRSNAGLLIRDPANRIVYSAHQYFDRNTSGQYAQPFAQDGATADIGARRLRPFVQWLRANKLKGHIGEFGVPFGDPGWLPVLDQFLDEIHASCDVLTGMTYWAAGDWADAYPLTVQPARNSNWADRPQMQVLLKAR
jgi:aryl-phospho-beta-D-glucosidase BglC (GH1 family)